MTFDELKQKALSLPYSPGVYIMQDKTGRVIYVGKAKKLKNRVSQYFQDSSAHSLKTRRMVSQIFRFDTIVASSEFEALVLECSLIKRHMPHYNILLKDDKGYPYIRVDMKKPYPAFELVSRVQNDGAEYFGPFGGRYITQKILDTIRLTFLLPGCSRDFSRERGAARPCLNYHIGNCAGWCGKEHPQEAYYETMVQAVRLLKGKYSEVLKQIKADMEKASDALRFEEAARLRDRMRSLESLQTKQLVTAGSRAHTDVIGYFANETRACFSVLHYLNGNLLDKDYQILPLEQSRGEAVSALVKQYYIAKGAVPGEILLPEPMEDGPLYEQLLREKFGRRVRIHVPERGEGIRLLTLAESNAREEVERITTKDEKRYGLLISLQRLLDLPSLPKRIEAYDISNTAGTDIVAGMVVYEDGKPLRRAYRTFKIKGLENQDDYESMRQVIFRRFEHFSSGDEGFRQCPDLILMDGGKQQVICAEQVLRQFSLSVPVFGMVKDNRHRTRALVDVYGNEIGISSVPPLFAMIGGMQEEVHRFAITFHKKRRSGRVKSSRLEDIPGIGEVRRALLLKQFKSVKRISEADLSQLNEILPANAAKAVWHYFHKNEESI